MKSIYVVAHPESIHHVQGLGGGWYDTSLTENGRRQATRIATSLHNEIGAGNTPIYSSDLKRCAETAGIFAEVFNSTVILDRNLREMSYGDGEGKPKEWGDRNITPQPRDGNRLDHRICRGAESRREVGTRIQSILGRIVDEPDENVIVITHGFALTFVIMAWFPGGLNALNLAADCRNGVDAVGAAKSVVIAHEGVRPGSESLEPDFHDGRLRTGGDCTVGSDCNTMYNERLAAGEPD